MNDQRFEPKIIAFACNWSGYPAAVYAGKKKIEYPPNVNVLKVMCTGSIDLGILIQVFENGADGIIICGCETDKCHYISGDERSEEGIRRLKMLLDILGLDVRRIETLRISPQDGEAFAAAMREFTEKIRAIGQAPKMPIRKLEAVAHEKVDAEINELIEETKAYRCVECGKCTVVCPIPKFEPDYAVPRMVVLRSAEGIGKNIADDKDIWICTTCGLCNSMCPFKVDYCRFIQGLRVEARSVGYQPVCAHKDVFYSAMRIMANSNLNQDRLKWVNKETRINERGDVYYFVGCLPHFDAIFAKRKLNLCRIPDAAVRLMNAAGVIPVVSNEEKCCGHDLLWTGDEDNFLKLMDKNLNMIEKSGAKIVIFSCPECYRTFSVDYQDFEGDLDFEMLHITEYLNRLMNEGKLVFPEIDEEIRVTYHDSCRLGIHLEKIDSPRHLIEISGMKLLEMENTKNKSYCCGNCAWTNCSSITMKMQLERMKEAKNTGADILLTSDPKCQIHLSCAATGELPIDKEKIDIPIKDISVILAELMEAQQNKQFSLGAEKNTISIDSS